MHLQAIFAISDILVKRDQRLRKIALFPAKNR